MRGSAKGEEPHALRAWKEGQRSARIEPRYTDLGTEVRQATRQVLFVEQTGQCVYCGRNIRLEIHNSCHIEHFRPRSRYPEHELAYENLYLSCGPLQESGGTRPTCGNGKQAWFDENCHIEPAPEEPCQRRFVFASNGQIRGDGSPEADKMIAVLKLNHSELVAERSALIEGLDDELNGGLTSRELIEDFLEVSPKGARVSFANVAIRYLHNQRGDLQQA